MPTTERPDSQAFGDLLQADMSNKRRRLGALADAVIHGPTERQADQALAERLRAENIHHALAPGASVWRGRVGNWSDYS